jgi:hypothetical protein
MAIFHLKYQTISRGKKRSATAAASYRSASRIADTRQRRRNRRPPLREHTDDDAGGDDGGPRKGKIHDYRAKMGVLKAFVKLPADVLESLIDRAILWNGAEDSEVRCNAVVAREMDVALPHELSQDEQWGCAEDMADWLIYRYRVGVDIAYHQPAQKEGHDQRNFHAHIMFTSRALTAEGFGKKTRELDSFKTRDTELRAIRQAWQDIVNARLAKAGLEVRIDCRTLEEQGIDRIPQIHVGVNGKAMDDREITPVSRERYDSKGRVIDWEDIDAARSRAEFNAEIIELNKRREQLGPLKLETQIKNIECYIAILMEKCSDLEALIPASMLPLWARVLVERYKQKAAALLETFIRAKEADDERQEDKKREGIHARMKRMRDEIEELERAKTRRESLQRLYIRIESIVAMRPPVTAAMIDRPPPRMLSVEQYRIELVARAEIARTKVPPEYRPRIEIRNVIWDSAEHRNGESSLGYHFHTGPPADNGGLAEPPPSIVPAFNVAAGLEPEQSCKQKIRVGFGPA